MSKKTRDESSTRRKPRLGEPDEVCLFVFPPSLFPDRDAIRSFVRGPIGNCLDMAVQSALDNGMLDFPELARHWRRHASSVMFDFGNLARAAANHSDAPLCVTFEGNPEHEATGNLETMHAAFEIALATLTTNDYVRPFAALIEELEDVAREVRTERSMALGRERAAA